MREMIETKPKLWLMICALIAVFLLTNYLGTLYHPWDDYLEESGIELLDMKNLKNDAAAEDMQSENLMDRMDVIKNNIYQICFSDSSDSVVNFAANELLSPIVNAAKSVALAAAYTGMGNRHQYTSPNLMYCLFVVIGFFLLFYYFQFGTNRVVQRITDKCDPPLVSKAEKMVISYCVDGVISLLFLIASYWMMMAFSALRDIGFFYIFDGAMSSSSAFLVIPAAVIIIAACIFFFILVIGLLICAGPYLLLMALPVAFVAWLPAWVPMLVRMLLCLVLEVLMIGYVFHWLYDRLNLWNTVKKMLQIILWIVRFVFHPIRTIHHIFTGSEW